MQVSYIHCQRVSGVVAETMKLLGKGLYGYQILVGFRHTIAKYLGGDMIPKALYEKFFEQLNDV